MNEFPDGPRLSSDELNAIFIKNPFPLLRRCREEFGDTFTLDLGDCGVADFETNGRWVFVSAPEDIKTLFAADGRVARGGAANAIQFQKILPPLASTVVDGEMHLCRRRAVLGSFQKDVHVHTEKIQKLATGVLSGVPKDGCSFSLYECMKAITKETIVDQVLGVRSDGEAKALCEQLVKFEDARVGREEKDGIIEELNGFMRRTIVSRSASAPKAAANDVFSRLLAIRGQDGQAISDDELAHEMTGLLSGGVGTSAITLSWALIWVLTNPAVAEALAAERANVLDGGPVTAENAGRLEYAEFVLKETLRISPLLSNSALRLLAEPLVIGGHKLPKGTLVACCHYLLHMRAELYPEPEVFRPERFKDARALPHLWAPFGGGARRCVGQVFAMHQMKVILSTVLDALELELIEPSHEPEFQGAFYAPKGGVNARVLSARGGATDEPDRG